MDLSQSHDNAVVAAEFESGSYRPLPIGWRRLGSGVYRIAFRGPDGLVYKVEKNGSWNTANEAKVFQYWKDNNYSFAPDFRYWPDANVMVMPEYKVLGTSTWDNSVSIRDQVEAIQYDYEVTDSHEDNLALDGDRVVVIDGGNVTVGGDDYGDDGDMYSPSLSSEVAERYWCSECGQSHSF